MMSERIKRNKNWRSRNDEAHARRMEIGDLARAAAAPGWSRLAVRHAQVGSHAVTTVTRDGHEITVEGAAEPFQGMEEPFRCLRELSYRVGAGTWFTCELEFSPGGRGYTGRVDSSAPPFVDVPPMAALAELTVFPREEPPGWLLAALPTAAPLGLPTAYGDRYDRWRGHSGDRRPQTPPPITGELAYRPATTMTARAFGHDQEHNRCLIYLAEQADDSGAEHLLVTSYQEGYWVARQDMRGTNEGVRSITLDDTTLRLELTLEAADLLETETVFEVRLDLPPETLGELRTVLPGMLRSVAQAPELIGF
ncbi:hypothetical protein GCM10018953_70660 [Streptosporangium nondiastaticum]|uniref:hypothetical protein n=1 Tax=Streptosporangium nondiastaticum TaxID=35764 RepID=UPI0031F735A9